MEFVPAKCTSCGGDLMIPENMKTVICIHCGTKFIINDNKNQQPSPTIENWMKLADNALESGNAPEAMNYFNKIIEVESENYLAWLGKGRASVVQYSVKRINFDEMHLAFKIAWNNAPEDKKDELFENILEFSNFILNEFQKSVAVFYAEYCRDESTVLEYIDKAKYICDQIEVIYNLAPENEINVGVLSDGLYIAIELLNDYYYANYNSRRAIYKLKDYEARFWKEKYNTYIERIRKFDPNYEPFIKLQHRYNY